MNASNPPQPTTEPPTKRGLLLDCAQELFTKEGFHATGIDRILDRAGVAKMTLYNNFGSKEQLIVEVLDRASEGLTAMMGEWAGRSSDPFEQVMDLFDGLGEWFSRPDCCGCLLQAAAAEFSDPESPVTQAIQRHDARVRTLVTGIARATECRDPDDLATQICLLLAGSLSAVRVCRCRQPADAAKRAAAILLEDACRRAESPGL